VRRNSRPVVSEGLPDRHAGGRGEQAGLSRAMAFGGVHEYWQVRESITDSLMHLGGGPLLGFRHAVGFAFADGAGHRPNTQDGPDLARGSLPGGAAGR
jgi:hypothetical protein